MAAVLSSMEVPTKADFYQAITERTAQWYSLCLKITRDAHLAEDAVQVALISAWTRRHQYQHTARLDTWISRIAVNAALQLLRKRQPDRWEVLETEIRDESVGPMGQRHAQELEQDLDTALNELSDFERVCFVLKHLQQWRLQESVESLNTSIGRTKQGVFRATQKLRVSMKHLRSEA